jgi:hypothetical protein
MAVDRGGLNLVVAYPFEGSAQDAPTMNSRGHRYRGGKRREDN